jgi:hypothetical protein
VQAPPSRLPLNAGDWLRGEADLIRLDEQADDLAARGSFEIELTGEGNEDSVLADEVPLHLQRWSGHRNAVSREDAFSALLRAHRALHPLEKPLVRADYRHALDVWQWVLRLDPEADAALQAAALFHDVERIFTEADSRREKGIASQDYDAFKARHAKESARVTDEILDGLGFSAPVRRRAAELIAGHDRPDLSADPDAADIAVLNDADALSYFSLNSPGYLAYFGEEQARRKIAWTLRRLSSRGRSWLARLRLPRRVAALLPDPGAET